MAETRFKVTHPVASPNGTTFVIRGNQFARSKHFAFQHRMLLSEGFKRHDIRTSNGGTVTHRYRRFVGGGDYPRVQSASIAMSPHNPAPVTP